MDALKACLKILEQGCIQIEAGDPRFRDPRITIHPLDAKNIHQIQPVTTDRVLSFIDGGNTPILTGPNFTVELTRIYFNLFHGRKRRTAKNLIQRIEFFTVITAHVNPKNEVEYQGHLIPLKPEYAKYLPEEKYLRLKSNDPTIAFRGFSAPASKVADAARRFAEWKHTELVILHELTDNDVVVRDGSLQTGITNESYFANGVYAAALKKNVIFTGFAKSNRFLTTTGNSLSKVIKQLGDLKLPRKAWYYHPVADIKIPDHKAELFYLNLHPLSRTTFRFEIFRDKAKMMTDVEINALLSDFVANSNDLAYPGYPYGLVDADLYGAASSREAAYYCELLLSLAEQRQDLEDLVAAINAHDIINQLRSVV